MISDILKKVHRKFSKDTDYPEAGGEDLLVRLDYVDDAIDEWEDCVNDGIMWPELVVSDRSMSFSGSGTDPLFDDFLCFLKLKEDGDIKPAMIVSGSCFWTEVTAGEGSRMEREGTSPFVFWKEGSNRRTLPAISGNAVVPYLKKATRFPLGTETTEPEMKNPKFIEEYVLAQIFLDNSDDTLYQSFMTSAAEKLKSMKYKALV